jgi:hypothetical protein
VSSPESEPVDPLATTYLPYKETMRRIHELTRGMSRIGGAGVTTDLNDETLLAIDAGLARVRRGTR